MSLPSDPMPALCSIHQRGDRYWWCSTHARDAETCDPTESVVLAVATRAVMRHYGYTDHQIKAAEDWQHADSDCSECWADDGKSLHYPGFDDLAHVAEILRVAFNAAGVEL